MADELKPVDMLEHPEADLSANAEKGAAIGGATGVIAGAIAGSPFGPAGAAIGAVIGGVAGAVGTSVVVAATDTQGENHSDRIQAESDATIRRNELNDDLLPSAVERIFDHEDI
jgi:phage tail tape-measure protein